MVQPFALAGVPGQMGVGGKGVMSINFESVGSGLIPSFQNTPILKSPPEFIESLPMAIYACDAYGRILWFNRQAASLWGRAPILGSDGERYCGSHKLYLEGRHVEREESPVATVLRTGIPARGIESKVERPDGSSIWAMVHVEPIDEDGRIVGAVNCFHEVTDRIQTTELLAQQNQRLAVTYEHAGIGIAEVTAEGRLQRVNAHLADLLGYSAEELIGRSIFDPALAGNVETDRSEFERQVRGEIDSYTVEKLFVRKDRSELWIAVTSSSVKDAKGRFLYAVRAQHDITTRKQAEAALVRHVEEQSALYEFTDGLQRADTLDQIYDLALASITRALRCDRTSVLLFDDQGTMRFVASRGLSESYRQAVEGHSPWASDATDPQPISIEEVARSDLPGSLKQVVHAEGIRALAFIPIVSGGQLLGKFMTYYDRPYTFSVSEVRLALTVARQLGFALERVRLETARQKAERAAGQLVAIVESSHDAIVSKDLNGVITSWNVSAERLFGYRADETVGKHITMLISEDRLDEEPEILRRIRRGERVDHFETVRRRKDGSLLDISLTISPIRDDRGRIVGASKIARDITERKAAEAKLKASERQMKDLLSAIPAAIYTTDADGKITYFNQAAVELSGRTPQLGTDEWCVTWKLYRPDGTPLPHDECPMAIALKEGRAIRNVEAVAERPDGVRIPFIPYPTPLRDENGAVIGGINMLVDISERKQAETQQRLLFNELNHRVKNNMQMLQSLLNLAGQRSHNAETHQILQEAGNRVAAMAAAQRILYGTAKTSHFSAKNLVQAVCETARQIFPRTIAIQYDRVDEIELSNDTAVPLALILNELLTNAVKYGTTKNVGAIRVGLIKAESLFTLYVEDDGPGFDLRSVRNQSSGLKLVQGLARQLRGELKVTSTPATRCSVEFS